MNRLHGKGTTRIHGPASRADSPRMEEKASNPASERLEWLDGLRALAVLSVLVDHLIVNTPRLYGQANLSSFNPASIWREGSHGVDLFFVISGFCLALPSMRKLAAGGTAGFDVARFYAKRLARILPPYWAAIGLFALGILALPALGLPLPLSISPRVNAADILRQALFIDRDTRFANASFWSLAVEMRWYFVFPLALWCWIRAPRLFTTILFGSAFGYMFTRTHNLDQGTLPGFLFGIIAADLAVRRAAAMRTVVLVGFAAIVFALLTQSVSTMPDVEGIERAAFWMQTNVGWQAAAFALVLAVARHGALRCIFSWRPLVAVGTASYSIYLVHEPVIGTVATLLAPFSLPISLTLSAAVAIFAGFGFWAVVERPLTSPRTRRQIVDFALTPIANACFAIQCPAQITLVRNPENAPRLQFELARFRTAASHSISTHPTVLRE